MKDHPEYELKQPQIFSGLATFNSQLNQAQAKEQQKKTFKNTLDGLKKHSQNDLNNISIENLQNLLEESVGLIEDLTQANSELDSANAGLNKDRSNLGDADVYEIIEKKQAEVAKCESEIQTSIKPQIAELEELFKHTKSASAPLQ